MSVVKPCYGLFYVGNLLHKIEFQSLVSVIDYLGFNYQLNQEFKNIDSVI